MRFERRKAIRTIAVALVGIALISIAYRQVSIDQVLNAASRVHPISALFTLALLAGSVFLSGLRWHLMIGALGSTDSLKTAMRQTLISYSLGAIIPGKVGEASKAAFVTGPQGIKAACVGAALIEKIMDLFGLCLCGLLFALLAGSKTEETRWLLAVLAFGCLLGLKVLSYALKFEATGWIKKIAPARRVLVGQVFWSCLGITVVCWVIQLSQFAIIGSELAIRGGAAITASSAAIATIAGVLPITLLGIGTRDAVLVALLTPYMDRGAIALLGMLGVLRVVLPAFAGYPILISWRSGALAQAPRS